LGLLIAVFLLGLAFGVCLLPGLFLLVNLRDESQADDAQCFEDAFGPAGEK
jgi:hypothetical protein